LRGEPDEGSFIAMRQNTMHHPGTGIDSAGDTGQYPGMSAARCQQQRQRYLKIPPDAL
jgi:hypothetical protein